MRRADWGSEIPPSPPVVPPSTPATPETPVKGEPQQPSSPHLLRSSGRKRSSAPAADSAQVVFRFGSDEADVSFACRIDGGLFRPCPERLARRFSVGSHVVRVVARDAAGNGDRTPAVFRFRVKRVG